MIQNNRLASDQCTDTLLPRPGDWLVGGGEMARFIKTPLGPIETWPQSLRTSVSLTQASGSPIALIWGPGHVQIYNDGYWPICGAKHPSAMGQDFRECWASAFPVIGEAYASACSGKTAYLENMRMFLDRYGFLEETWFTFSFSPITDETGKVGGLFHPVTEMSVQMLSERRTKTLRDVANRVSKAKSTDETFQLASAVLAESDFDLPFVLFYLLESDTTARLVGQTGIAPGTLASPLHVNLGDDDGSIPWPITFVARSGKTKSIDNITPDLQGMAIGPYPELPKMALTLPITQPGSDKPAAIMIAGVSSRLLMTEQYLGFYDLLAATVSNALTNARAYEDERKRIEALAEIDRAKTAFFSNVSHEFRTPLTLILGPMEDALAKPEHSLSGNSLDMTYRNALRLLRLVNSLLDFSRIEAGRTQASFEPVDLTTLTIDLASVFRSAIEKAGLKLLVNCETLREPVFVDRDMWEKIVLNLLSNAFKFTFEGEIEVRLTERNSNVELSIRDTGIGVTAHELPRLFDRFHRIEGVKARTHEGSGIGLALVQELVHLHGGQIFAHSQPGHGTTFTILLNFGTAHLAQERIHAKRTMASTSTTSVAYLEEVLQWLPDQQPTTAVISATQPDKKSGAHILIADDNADLRTYIASLLTPFYDIETVADGKEALAAISLNKPDLVITDVMMPNLDGFGFVRALRNNPETRTIKIIMLSARAGQEASVEGLTTGADDYLAKPFTSQELLARVHNHLAMASVRGEHANRLQKTNQELEAFNYSVSHDLKAPLRSIKGFVEILQEEYATKLDANGLGYLQRIHAASMKIGNIIEDLLQLSRVGYAELFRRTINLSELARESMKEIQQREPERKIDFVIQNDIYANVDRRLMRIVFDNFLGNAWKYTSKVAHPRVEFGAFTQDDKIVYYVQDNGAGFSMKHADSLFKPFVRLHSESDFPGSGIGLATVQRILNRHKGYAWAKGEKDHGASFFFTFSPDDPEIV